VAEGMDVVLKINEAFVDKDGVRPHGLGCFERLP